MAWFFEKKSKIDRREMEGLLDRAVTECRRRICEQPKKVLLLPPDITRAHCGAGWMTERMYNHFT